MTVTLEEFFECAVRSGLFGPAELQSLQLGLASADALTLARELVKRGRLTKYQATMLLEGRVKGLVYNNYEVLDKLGHGGMGLVFKARHRLMDRMVALKVLPPAATRSPDLVKRFLREAKAAARLVHPNIVAAFDADEADGLYFLVMEFVPGCDLATLIRRDGRMSPEAAVECIVQAARGLHYAHQQGVVHRDVKPSNLILADDGTVKILDLGLARLVYDNPLANGDDLTRSGTVMGTVDYMAPEQAEDMKLAGAQSDIYSLGCTLYFLLTGCTLFKGDTLVKKIIAHRNTPPPSLRESLPHISPALDDVFQKMVAKRPEDRFTTCADLILALETCRAQGLTSESATRRGISSFLAAGGDAPHATAAEPVCHTAVALPSADAPNDTLAFNAVAPQTVRARPPRSTFLAWTQTLRSVSGRTWLSLAICAVVLPLLIVAVWALRYRGNSELISGAPGDSQHTAPAAKTSDPGVDRSPTAAPGDLAPASRGTSTQHQLPRLFSPAANKPRVLLIIAHNGYSHLDFENLIRALDSRADVDVASTQTGPAIPRQTQESVAEPAQARLLLRDVVSLDDWDTAILCGGDTTEFDGQAEGAREVRRIVTALHNQGKPVAGICTGSIVLANVTGLLRQQQATCSPDRRHELSFSGAIFVDQPVVVSNRILTGRDPQAVAPLVDRLLQLVGESQR